MSYSTQYLHIHNKTHSLNMNIIDIKLFSTVLTGFAQNSNSCIYSMQFMREYMIMLSKFHYFSIKYNNYAKYKTTTIYTSHNMRSLCNNHNEHDVCNTEHGTLTLVAAVKVCGKGNVTPYT